MGISSCFRDIGLKAPVGHDLIFLLDVIGHVTIQFSTGHFLLVVLWNQAFSTGFRDTCIQWWMWRNG